MKKILYTSRCPAAVGPYSQAVRTGNLIFTSGQLPLTPDGALLSGTAADQARQALENIRSLLEDNGSSLDNIVKITLYLVDMNDFAEVNPVFSEYFPTNPPARTCAAVSALPKNSRVEIDAVAAV